MAVQYDTDEESKLHSNVIHSPADQYRLDEATIRKVYEGKLHTLMGRARIRIYPLLLAVRHVRITSA